MRPRLRLESSGEEKASLLTWVVSWGVFAALVLVLATQVDYEFLASLDFTVVYQFRWALLKALGLTLTITLAAMAAGFVIGLVCALSLESSFAPVRWIVTGYVELLRNTPLVVQLFWIHFALPYVSNVSTTAVQSGIIAMSLQASAYICDIIRAGIAAVPKGQREAAEALGLPLWSQWTDVILPQALKMMIPPMANTAITYFKLSAILSLLSIGELMTTATSIVNATFKPVEVLTFVAIIYFLLGIGFSSATHRLEIILGLGRRS